MHMVKIGTTLERRGPVPEQDCISFLGPDVKPSLATPAMISRMEFTARDAVLPHLAQGQDTVGTHVNVSHLAATPAGAEITYRATVRAIEGRKIIFDVEAADEQEVIGKGTHERFVIDVARFAEGLKKKFGQT